MKRVVYILGAGFSAPAGLPVISNFIFKARELFTSNPNEFKEFADVFSYIDSLSKSRNYLNVDLFNIEEIFSLSDMHRLINPEISKMEDFIKRVIMALTPRFQSSSVRSMEGIANITWEMFSKDMTVARYVAFLASMHFVRIIVPGDDDEHHVVSCQLTAPERTDIQYSIITLNYDMIIEECNRIIQQFRNAPTELNLAKLHGSVDSAIVPPTWNKKIENIKEDWAKAASWLSEATDIRIIGYSMPETDSYIRHLFSTAFVESDSLQRIEIVCLDRDGSVENRYRRMFVFPRLKFMNINFSDVLNALRFGGGGRQGEFFVSNLLDHEQMWSDASKKFD